MLTRRRRRRRTCIEENSRRNFSCSANCEGVYLDIWKTQEDNVATDEHEIPETETESLPRWAQKIMANIQGKEDDANRNKISKLVREYNAYKKSKLQNFRFNPVKASSQFSKFFQGIVSSVHVCPFAKVRSIPPQH